MAQQTFNTDDYLRLEVGLPPSGLANRVVNPSGELGAWWWLTGQDFSTVRISGGGLQCKTVISQTAFFDSSLMPVSPGHYVRFGFNVLAVTAAHTYRLDYQWFDATKTPTGVTNVGLTNTSSTGVVRATAVPVPPAAYVRVRLVLSKNGPDADINSSFTFKEAFLYQAATSGALSAVTYSDPIDWTGILSPAIGLKTIQEALSVGTISATIRSATLDPAVSSTLTPGRPCRVSYYDGTTWLPIITAKITSDPVTYDLGPEVPAAKVPRIELTAVDAVADLAAVKAPRGVANVRELAAVIEPAEVVPWNLNGSGDQYPDAAVIWRTTNDNATVLDQVALTRDTVAGYAWVDGAGVLQVWDAASMPATTYGTPMDEDHYAGLVIDYDRLRCVNSVTVKVATLVAGQPVEAVYGPYESAASITALGGIRLSREITIVSNGTNPATQAAAAAAALLAANDTPTKRVLSVTKALRTPAEVAAWCGIGLYTKVTVSNTDAGISTDMRVTSVEHEVSPKKWLVTLGFEIDGSVAASRVTPSATGTAQSLNQAQAGTVSSGAFSAVETNNDVAVVFAQAYDAAPVVALSLTGSASVNQVYPLLALTPTTTGFTARFRRSVGTGALTAAWHATPATQ